MIRRAALLTVALCALVVAGASPAAAHAVLESSTPGDGQELARAPDRITLRFNEPVALPAGGVRLFDATGRTVTVGPALTGDPAAVQVPVEQPLSQGSYVATWRVVSADGHPVRGALVFSVGDPVRVDAAVMRQVFGAGADRPAAIAAAVVRWLLYLGVLAAAGGCAFLRWAAQPADRAALRPLVRPAAIAGVAAAAATIPLQAAQIGGQGLAGSVRPDLLWAAATDSVGVQSLLVAFGLALLIVTLADEGDRLADALGLTGAAVAIAALLVAGHTRTVGPPWVLVPADAVHLTAAAVWAGGLVLLWPAVRRRRAGDDPVGAAEVVSRFSSLATVAAAAVTVAGVVMAWVLTRTATALTTTIYGRVLMVKVAAVGGVLLIGAYNNRRLVPAIRAAATAVPDPAAAAPPGAVATVVALAADTTHAWSRLRRTVGWEVIGLVAVAAVTAVLVATQPAAEAAGVTGAFSTAVPIGGGHELDITVDPNRVGLNEVHVYLLDPTGRPADARDLRLQLSLPSDDIGPIVRTASPISPGHWLHVGRELAVPGRWHIEAQVTISRFERPTAAVDVDVRPRS